MKLIKKYWYAVAVIFIPITATVIYFAIKAYQRKKFTTPDTTDTPETTIDMATAIDYRGRKDLTLGLQNNNPGNIRTTADPWQGKVGDNLGFVVFISLRYGIRAAIKNIATLITDFGTLQAYITAYAPPSENDTAAYITFVSDTTGIAPDVKPTLDHDTLKALVLAHFAQENGQAFVDQYIPDSEVEAALSLTPYGA